MIIDMFAYDNHFIIRGSCSRMIIISSSGFMFAYSRSAPPEKPSRQTARGPEGARQGAPPPLRAGQPWLAYMPRGQGLTSVVLPSNC